MRVSEQGNNGSWPSGKLPGGAPSALPGNQAPVSILDPEIFGSFRDMLDPETLAHIYREFLLTTRQRIDSLSEAPDPEALSRLAHTMKGTAGMLGANCIAARAAQLEHDLTHEPNLLQTAQQLTGDCHALESALAAEQVSL